MFQLKSFNIECWPNVGNSRKLRHAQAQRKIFPGTNFGKQLKFWGSLDTTPLALGVKYMSRMIALHCCSQQEGSKAASFPCDRPVLMSFPLSIVCLARSCLAVCNSWCRSHTACVVWTHGTARLTAAVHWL